MVKIVSKEGEIFKVNPEILKISTFLQVEIEDHEPKEKIFLPLIRKDVIKKIIQFCQHYQEDPLQDIEKPLRTNNIKELVPPWYGSFVDIKLEEIYELILAADYLCISPLNELCGAAIAALMKGKKNDFTQEEEQQIAEENKWAEEAI
ncbi:unnamed protein product [Moneuplotes crassus]|uniref:SKP1 component POZ domain-containing protein n=1 Tax=Euplotes crassus TaxID=5936 RepID=A0AAD2D7W7_EUPCR|nr:unnamed protein product [Moneuplotes crassus]